MTFFIFEKIGGAGLTDRTTDRRTGATLNAAPRDGRLINKLQKLQNNTRLV